MYQIKTQCGFIIPSIFDVIKSKVDGINDNKIAGLLGQLNSFELESNIDLSNISDGDYDLLFVIHNLIIRGEPTFLLWNLEKEFARLIGSLKCKENYGSLSHYFEADLQLVKLCWKALHFIDARLDKKKAVNSYHNSWENLDSRCEEDFIFHEIPTKLFNGDGEFLIQLIQSQRSLESMVDDERIRKNMESNFREQLTDFSFEFPYLEDTEKRGICIEVDGPHHKNANQINLDQKRDQASLESGWNNTIRFPVEGFGSQSYQEKFNRVQKILDVQSVKIFKHHFNYPLYQTPEGRKALQLTLSPFAIARIQMALLRGIFSGAISLNDDIWKIAVLERDVPCAYLAIQNFKELYNQLSLLEGKSKVLPHIKLEVFVTNEFKECNLNKNISTRLINDFLAGNDRYDLCIDIAVLERKGLGSTTLFNNAKTTINIRSSFYSQSNTKVLCGNRINWQPIVDDNKKPFQIPEKVMTYFLQNIFRKKGFRSGQLPILNLALQNETVIGLLPTGGGKSMTYQIASLLQPGVVLIVDPIKSLMKDQVDGLRKGGISRTVYINSSLKSYKERNRAYQRMKSGAVQFCFISPERLQMESFRAYLQEMYDKGIYFTYAVLDEVHCVSEWGHDFRTSYLSLGKNLIKYCKAKEGEVALFGLTATASFDVLADVQRELSGNSMTSEIPDDHIVRHETTNRDEIQFVIDDVSLSDEEVNKIREKSRDFEKFKWGIKESLGQKKQQTIQHWLENISGTIRNFNANSQKVINDDLVQLLYPVEQLPDVNDVFKKIQLPSEKTVNFWGHNKTNAGLVFTPHRSWYFGVTDKYKTTGSSRGIYDFLSTNNPKLSFGTYMGSDEKDSAQISEEKENDNLSNQENYLDDKIDVMVSTKAFGMGIDKSNIRFTIHNSYPGSIESFVQEAGRGGRDRKMALAIVLFNNQSFTYHKGDKVYFYDVDFEIQSYFHSNSYKGPQKEKAILYELLTNIRFPKKTNAEYLAELLSIEIDKEIVFKINYSADYKSLWLNDTEGQSYGKIILPDGRISISNKSNDNIFASQSLSSLLKVYQKNIPNELAVESIDDWLKQKANSILQEQAGIETMLQAKEVGDKFRVTIPFSNDKETVYEDIAKVSRKMHPDITAYIIKHKFSEDVEEYLNNLSAHYNWDGWQEKVNAAAKESDISVDDYKRKLAFRLGAMRDKSDTEKALYRLSLIGVIDEYTVDFRTKSFEVTIVKKSTEEYHKYLRYYLEKFYSTKRVDDTLAGLVDRKGNSDTQRMLNFLVEFLYSEIADKRKQSISAMKQLCEIGLEHGNIEMKSWIHLYFNSKYARKDFTIELNDPEALSHYRVLSTKKIEGEDNVFNASLVDWSNEGVDANIDWFFDFTRIVVDDHSNAQMDNLKHLRGACTRLLIINPTNFTFRFLRAYSALVLGERLPKDKMTFKPVFEDLDIGIQNFGKEIKDRKVFIKKVNKIHQEIVGQIENQYNLEYIFKIDELFKKAIFLEHVRWTKQFENKLSTQLKKTRYERANR